jgi:hypothetical protein
MSDPTRFDEKVTRAYLRRVFGEESGWQNDYGRHPVLAAAIYARYESNIERVRAFCERQAKEKAYPDFQK